MNGAPRLSALAQVVAASAADAAPGKKAEVNENDFLENARARYAGKTPAAATAAF